MLVQREIDNISSYGATTEAKAHGINKLVECDLDHSYFGKFRKRIGTQHLTDIFNSTNDIPLVNEFATF